MANTMTKMQAAQLDRAAASFQTKLLRCPLCHAAGLISHGNNIHCASCGASFNQGN